MLTKIIYKNFRSNLKNYILFFLSNIVAIMELFVFYGIRSIIKSSITDKVTAEALKTDFQIAVGIIAVITLMLMFYAMKCYIKLRIKDYSMFLVLGMKKKAVSLLLLFEYCIGCVISLILGIGVGRILLYIIQRLLVKYYPRYIQMHALGYQIYKNVCLASILIMVLVFVILLIWLDRRSLGMLMAEDKQNEKRPASYMWIILAVIGNVLMIVGIILYCGSDTQYLYAHGGLLMGLILAVVFGLALFLNLLKKCKNFYYRHMLDLNQLYSRYLNHMIILVLLIVVHFFSLSYLVVQTAELLPLDQYRSQYPYDVIWITEKDNKGYAKKLASTYNGTVTEVPMIRVSTYYGANHIGISEKTYRKLSKSQALNLKENQIAVRIENSDAKQEDIKDSAYWEVYSTLYAGKYFGKQDSDTLIDVKENEDIHFNIQSICTQTIVGKYSTDGWHENIIVFSDEYFNKQWNAISLKNDNASELELFTFPTTRREPVCQKLKQYNQKSSYHKMGKLQNNLYITDQYLNGQKVRALFSMSSKIFLIIASILSGFFIMSLKTLTEFPALQKRFEFFKCMGMRENQLKWNTFFEIKILGRIAESVSLVTGILYVGAFIHKQKLAGGISNVFFKYWIILVVSYILLNEIIQEIFARYILRKLKEN
ncbi:ABC transporter permease [Dorea longicatena]|uniref:ABC transporter permease n=1 Tax=Dorea longicatena TaxID=88431 RepID=UPI0022E51B71|nr:ABC transporter permease [Dorea longicatena]